MKELLFTDIDPELCIIKYLNIPIDEYYNDKISYTHRLLMLKHGKCKLTINNRTYNLFKNDTIYIPSGTVYSTDIKSGAQFLSLNFDFLRYNDNLHDSIFILQNAYDLSLSRDTISFTDTTLFSKPFVTFSCESLGERLYELLKEESTRCYAYRLRQKAILTDLLIYLYRIHSVGSDEEKYSVTENILDYIIKHCEEPLSCKSICEHFHYNNKTIQKMVHSATGMTLHQYIEETKMKRAAELLTNTDQKITEIAQQLQYYDSSHFSAVFRKYYSCTPLAFRKKYL